MTESAKEDTDEKFALGLLRDHLKERGESEFQCEENATDPPDIVVTWGNDAKWGVEVTRTYQQVKGFDKAKPVSSEQIAAFLRDSGKEFGENTKDIRKRDYTLFLEGPGPFSSWKSPSSTKRWKRETEEAIRQHIVSEKSCILKVPGVWLTPGEPGKRWTIIPSGGVGETTSATIAMLLRTLEDKTKKLPTWNGSFDERWLLLLNFYPLIDGPDKVEDTLQQLVQKNQHLAGFNGIFWSGYPDRMLIPIPLS